VLEILRGGLPTSAVNAPIILPEEFRKLQPSVALVEKMGRLYAQHFGGRGKGGMMGGRTFELRYHGDLASMPNTKPLFAALVKGLVSVLSDSHVNIVNATLIAKEKGFTINETRSQDSKTYANLVSLRAYDENTAAGQEQVIEGYASQKRLYISKLDRFNASFPPEGTLIVLHNYDEPGKIGGVGTVLGGHGINIRFMQVASLDEEARNGGEDKKGVEALMILGVQSPEGKVGESVLEDLRKSEGVLNVSLVQL